MSKQKTINIERSIAADDSCQFQLFAKGHFSDEDFAAACQSEFDENSRKHELRKGDIRRTYWRTVPAPADNIVCDSLYKESRPGRGAYPVTILDHWYPLHDREAAL